MAIVEAVNTTGDGIDPRCIAEDYDDPDVTGMLIGDHDGIAEDARRRRLSRLESLILALSDQHLMTGGAMLIVTWTIILGAGDVRKERSVYSLQVAIALANISSSIHLASLSILRFYLKDHKVQYTARTALCHNSFRLVTSAAKE
ncbi:hypothetical protein MGN70_007431 [Eutypa lata]|nr:hypothetical protein MGN70_007431 [Eutypa lata]